MSNGRTVVERPGLWPLLRYFVRVGTLGFGGPIGATLVGIGFVGPSFVMVLVLSELCVRFGGLPWMQGLL